VLFSARPSFRSFPRNENIRPTWFFLRLPPVSDFFYFTQIGVFCAVSAVCVKNLPLDLVLSFFSADAIRRLVRWAAIFLKKKVWAKLTKLIAPLFRVYRGGSFFGGAFLNEFRLVAATCAFIYLTTKFLAGAAGEWYLLFI